MFHVQEEKKTLLYSSLLLALSLQSPVDGANEYERPQGISFQETVSQSAKTHARKRTGIRRNQEDTWVSGTAAGNNHAFT